MGETPSTGGIGREIPFVASTLLFDASNGLFFEQSNGQKYVGIRGFMSGGVVDTKIAFRHPFIGGAWVYR